MNNSKDNNNIMKALEIAAKKLGMSTEQLKNAAEKGDVNSIMSHLSPENSEKMKKAMNTKQAKDIMNSKNAMDKINDMLKNK